MQDSLTQIKKAEDQAESELIALKEKLARARQAREKEFDDKIKEIKEAHNRRVAEIDFEIKPDFDRIVSRLLNEHEKKTQQIKQSYRNNLPRFFEEVAEKLK